MSDVNITGTTLRRITQRRLGGRWVDDWRPEDVEFWNSYGRAVARRNLIYSVFSEHIGFSVWSIWSVLVLFLGKDYGFDPAEKFLLTAAPTLVGALLRLPYTFAVGKFGGRNWTIASALLLLVPCIMIAILLAPSTPRAMVAIYIPLIILAALGAIMKMDNLSVNSNTKGAIREVSRHPETWIMSLLYIGTFGSFIGFGLAFGQVLLVQFPEQFHSR